ncbi:MAG: metal ABC transporter permease [Phycisphaerales bacterium]|nr:metal ABC transporter permease [Phycisphaerales bacterium]
MIPTLAQSLTQTQDEIPSLSDIFETITLRSGFNTNAVIIAATLLGIAAGIIGAFALLRKRSLTADALSHATLPGIAGAFLIASALGYAGRSLPILLIGATISGIIGVGFIHLILTKTRLKEDAAIGIVLSVFFGIGVVLLSVVQSTASSGAAGLNHFIYGQTAAMLTQDAITMGIIAIIAILIALIAMKEITAVCFNESFASVIGISAGVIDALILSLIVLVTVAGLQAVGLILIVAMLIIPPAAARFWTDRTKRLVILSAVIGALSGFVGSSMSALLPRKPAGAVIVLSAGCVFIISMLIAPRRGIIAQFIRNAQLKLRIAIDHTLEHKYAHPEKVQRSSLPLRIILRFKGFTNSLADSSSLTESGLRRGRRVRRNHMLWEQYLITQADIAPSHVDWSVDLVEHVLDEDLIHRLEHEIRASGLELEEVAR